MDDRKTRQLIIGAAQVLLTLIALLSYARAVPRAVSAFELVSDGAIASGHVSELVQVRSARIAGSITNYMTSLAPIVRFTSSTGETVSFQGEINNFFSSYRSGDFVEVIYLPTDQGNAKIHAFWQMWGACSLLLIVGTTALGYALYFVFP